MYDRYICMLNNPCKDLYRAANSYLAGTWWYQTAVKPTGYEKNYIAHISRIKHFVNVFSLCPATIGFVVICNAVVYIVIHLSFTTRLHSTNYIPVYMCPPIYQLPGIATGIPVV